MRKSVYILCVVVLCILFACAENKQDKMAQLMEEWNGKEIIFPAGLEFSLFGKDYVCDTIPETEYKIVTYIDSLGCASCKLRLPSWQKFIRQLDTLNLNVPVLFILHPFDARSLKGVLRRDNFDYPVCMDTEDRFNKVNQLASGIDFQTFLLDSVNRVVALGNPVHNPKIKDLYLSILDDNKEEVSAYQTDVAIESLKIDLGKFQETRRDTVIYIKNVGKEKLVILDVVASCGCTVVDYENRPVPSGDSLAFKIQYDADKRAILIKQ